MGGSMLCPHAVQARVTQSIGSAALISRSTPYLEGCAYPCSSLAVLSQPTKYSVAIPSRSPGTSTEDHARLARCFATALSCKKCLALFLSLDHEGLSKKNKTYSRFCSLESPAASRAISCFFRNSRRCRDVSIFKQDQGPYSCTGDTRRRLGYTFSRAKRMSDRELHDSSRVKAVAGSLSGLLPDEGVGQTEDLCSIVEDFIDFLNESWTPFHATAEAKRLLLEAGFQHLNEEDEWAVVPGGRYFFTRNMSSIIAFAVGQNYQAGNGFHVVAAHTDSPCPKLKPVSAASKSGFLNVGVQTYGGGLWHTWFDRDLSVAGRVLLKMKDGSLAHKLVKVRHPILRIPTLAIHLDRSVNTDGFKPNLETHLAPILATQVKSGLGSAEPNGAVFSRTKPHHSLLLQVLAEELSCEADEIVDFELNVCDTQPSCIGGAKNEFIFSGRLDNLASSYCALRALLDTCRDSADLVNESCIRMVALFDNEEVGSDSAQGAGSPTMFQAMKRISTWLNRSVLSEGVVERTIRRSFLVSADMAHALHPNYPERHEDHHQPKLHEGLVIKHNANQRYATNAVTAFLFKEVAKARGIPTQNFVVRNDMGCGSTIGPILASGIGIRTVDCGMPQLSMHSVREMCGTEDIDITYRHFKAFYHLFTKIDAQLSIDS